MDKQGNTYTLIYASVLIIIVAILLALASQGLRSRQARNEVIAKKRDILKSINIVSNEENAEFLYEKHIGSSNYIVDFEGNRVEGDAISVDMAKELIKPAQERLYPVYEANMENGELKYIVQTRGAGLWGPLWGYISLNEDKNTIYGAYFGHKGETPGLGAEINLPHFQKQFQGKQLFDNEGILVSIHINKGNTPVTALHEVDGISGGTITSKAVEVMLKECLKGYENFLKK